MGCASYLRSEKVSLTETLANILDLPRPIALEELAAFKATAGKSDFKAAVAALPRHLKPALFDLNQSEIDRRKIPSLEGFRVGDRVRIKSTPLVKRQISRGRFRQHQPKRRVLERRIGQVKQSIGHVSSRGSRRIFYIRRVNLDRTLSVLPICPYPSLIDLELTILEFSPPMLLCVRPSGSFAPMLTIEDIEKI
jgi:hypothetical protein